jgi:hypothetical protein
MTWSQPAKETTKRRWRIDGFRLALGRGVQGGPTRTSAPRVAMTRPRSCASVIPESLVAIRSGEHGGGWSRQRWKKRTRPRRYGRQGAWELGPRLPSAGGGDDNSRRASGRDRRFPMPWSGRTSHRCWARNPPAVGARGFSCPVVLRCSPAGGGADGSSP